MKDQHPANPSISSRDSRGSFDLIEAGDLGRSMGKDYLSNLEDIRKSHARLKGIYYIFVNHYQQMYNPNAQYLCFCTMREKDVPDPILGTDLWKVNNGTDELTLVWSLPHRESWKQLRQDPHTDPQLSKFMALYEKGKLWTKKEQKNNKQLLTT